MSEYVTDPSLLEKLNGSSEYVTDPALLEKLNRGMKPGFVDTLKGMSVEDWKEKSLLAPSAQAMTAVTPFGILRPDFARQQMLSAGQNIAEKGKALGQGLYEVAQHPIESAQRAYQSITENPGHAAGELVKGAIYDPQFAIAPAADAAILAGRGAKAVGKGAMAVGETAADVGRGALGRATGYIAKPGEAPVGYQVKSSRIPLTNEFTSPEDWAKFQAGEMPYGQFPPTTPIQQLPKTPIEKAALMASGGEIPAQGQAARAFGERIGETYRNPITAALDIGSMFIPGNPGVPLVTAARTGLAGVQGAADWLLSKKGFDPSLPEKMAAYQSGKMPMPGTPPAPIAPSTALTVQAPGQTLPPSVMPMGGPPRAVNIEGQRSTLPYQIDTSNSQAARPQVKPISPAELSQQVAASKIQQPQINPQQQAILDQIRARGQQPTPAPVAPEGMEGLSNNWTPQERLTLSQQLAKLNKQQKEAPPLPEKTTAQLEREQRKDQMSMTAANNERVISEHVHGSPRTADIQQTTSLDPNAFDDKVTRGMANHLLKNNIDSIPVIDGMNETQVIHALYKEATGKGNGKASATRGKTTGTSLGLGEKATTSTRTSQQINKEINTLDQQLTDLREANLADKVKPGTPAGEKHMTEVNKLTDKIDALVKERDIVKKAEQKASKKKGPEVSKMMTEEDKNKFFNKIKSSGESELEQKVAGMTQAGREHLANTLKGQLSESTRDLIQPYLDAIEKYRTKK